MHRNSLVIWVWILFVLFLAVGASCEGQDDDDDDTGPDSGPGLADDDDDAASNDIEILIDKWGIPHIYAATDEDALFAAGYQVASDRLYQMEMLRRFALGRLSEVLGEDGLMRDMQARTFDFPRWGQADFEATRSEDPERARLIDAWVGGINKRIGEVRAGAVPLPFGYRKNEYDFLPEPWDEVDPYIVLKGAGFANDKTLEFEVALTLLYTIYGKAMQHVQIFKPAHPFFGVPPEDRPPSSKSASQPISKAVGRTGKLTDDEIRQAFAGLARFVHAMPAFNSSNNWAIDGRFTATGRSLIAGDPHLAFDFFGAPYPMHINSKDRGGSYNVAGFAYPGTPGITLGFNDNVIWTATTNMGDANDVWQVARRAGQVKIGDRWANIVTRTEQIIVRQPGSPVGQGQVLTMDYDDVPGCGVMLPKEIIGIPGSSLILGNILMNWTGFQGRPARWFMELNRVTSIDDFEQTVDRMREMSYNLVAADAAGIAYRVGLDVPDRTDTSWERAPWKAMDGGDAGSLWTGAMLKREQIPRGRAAKRGWIATANTDPWGFTQDGAIDNDPWYYGSFFIAGYRGQRIEDEISRLVGQGDLTLEEMKTLQMDTRSRMSDDLLPLLAQAHDKVPTDEDLAQFRGDADLDRIVQLLTVQWDREMVRDSAGALAWEVFMHNMTRGALYDDIPLAYDVAIGLMTIFVVKVAALAIQGEFPTGDEVLQQGRDVILLQAAAETAAWLKDRYGSVDPAGYAFADMKVTSFDEAFGMGMPVFQKPTDGGEDTLCVSTNIAFDANADRWASNYVPVERTVGTFAADGTPEVYVNYPVGNAADPASFDTQRANEDYIEGRYHKFLFDRSEVEDGLRKRIVLIR